MIQRMSSELYHRPFSEFPYLGSSQIKLASNLAKFKAEVFDCTSKKEKKKSFDLGTCAHSLVLEQDSSKYVVGPDLNKRSTAWKDFVKANDGKIILDQDQHDSLVGMAKKFSEHHEAVEMLAKSEIEKTILWEDQARLMQFKARPDGFYEKGNGLILWDYKTTKSADPQSFSRDIARYGYHISLAHYKVALEQEFGKKVSEARIVTQETVFPYLVAIYRLSPIAIEHGMIERTTLVNLISVAIEENSFPGYPESVTEIDLPAFVYNKKEDSLDWGVA